MKKRLIVFLALGLGLGGVAVANPGGGPERMLHLVRELDLTEEQMAVARAGREEMKALRESHREEAEAARETFKAQLGGGKPDAAVLHALVDDMVAARQEMAHAHVDNFLELYATLTAEQKAELAELIEEGPPERQGPPRRGNPRR